MTIKPLADRVVIKMLEAEETTEVKVDGETYTILRQGDVLAIVD